MKAAGSSETICTHFKTYGISSYALFLKKKKGKKIEKKNLKRARHGASSICVYRIRPVESNTEPEDSLLYAHRIRQGTLT